MKKIYNDKLLKFFMLLQPVIDIVTSIMINEFNLSLSLGMILRFMFLIYACGYIFINRDKKIIVYSSLWFIYCVVSLIGNYIIKDNFNILTHIVFLTKLIYFPFILLFWVLYFKKNKEIDKKWFIYIGLLVGASLIVSCFTKTAYCTYSNYEDCHKKGVVAWFNSANEYGLILLALLSLILMDYIKKYNLNNILALLLVVIFLSVLGTKASYIGLIGMLVCYIIFYFVCYFFFKKKDKKYKKKLRSIVYLIIVLGIVLASTPKLPISTNLLANYNRAKEEANINAENKTEEEIEQEVKDKMVYNGRSQFGNITFNIYRDSKLFNKFFGITNQGNFYEGGRYNKLNERDFHDLLIFYGVIAFVLEMLLPVYLIIGLIKKFIKNIKILLDDEVIITGLAICLILMGSFIAGHCLFQPAVSIYLAYLVALFNKRVMEMK